MKKLTMHEFRNLDIISKIAYAYKIKMGYYQFYGIRKDKRGWRVILDQGKPVVVWCPLCRKDAILVTAGYMNARTPFGALIEHKRCQDCMIKLPIVDKKILKLLGYDTKPKIEAKMGQMTLA